MLLDKCLFLFKGSQTERFHLKLSDTNIWLAKYVSKGGECVFHGEVLIIEFRLSQWRFEAKSGMLCPQMISDLTAIFKKNSFYKH